MKFYFRTYLTPLPFTTPCVGDIPHTSPTEQKDYLRKLSLRFNFCSFVLGALYLSCETPLPPFLHVGEEAAPFLELFGLSTCLEKAGIYILSSFVSKRMLILFELSNHLGTIVYNKRDAFQLEALAQFHV